MCVAKPPGHCSKYPGMTQDIPNISMILCIHTVDKQSLEVLTLRVMKSEVVTNVHVQQNNTCACIYLLVTCNVLSSIFSLLSDCVNHIYTEKESASIHPSRHLFILRKPRKSLFTNFGVNLRN